MPPKDHLPPGDKPVKDPIEIAEYDSAWPSLYQREQSLLRKMLAFVPGLAIEHFGSTSVPGLAAKPIIDIMISAESRGLWPSLVEPLQTIGYVYWDKNPKKDEMFLVKGMPPFGEKRTHHLHVYDFQGPRWKKELLFRDALRAHLEEAHRYAELKRDLALRFTYDREAYTDAKTDFIEGVLQKISHQ